MPKINLQKFFLTLRIRVSRKWQIGLSFWQVQISEEQLKNHILITNYYVEWFGLSASLFLYKLIFVSQDIGHIEYKVWVMRNTEND